MHALMIGVLIFLASSSTHRGADQRSELRLWKTPQGQMLTWIRPHECLHFDVGGTFETWRAITKLCHARTHWIFLSHEDREHSRLWKKIKNLDVRTGSHPEVLVWVPERVKSTGPRPLTKARIHDQKSRVFFLKQPKVLITGDAPIEQERAIAKWAAPLGPRLLVLGHHGRSLSTSEDLLNALSTLRWTWASSMTRPKRGARHRLDLKTRKKLSAKGLPVLGTHDWGTISLN